VVGLTRGDEQLLGQAEHPGDASTEVEPADPLGSGEMEVPGRR
jgi:hypothetical protein